MIFNFLRRYFYFFRFAFHSFEIASYSLIRLLFPLKYIPYFFLLLKFHFIFIFFNGILFYFFNSLLPFFFHIFCFVSFLVVLRRFKFAVFRTCISLSFSGGDAIIRIYLFTMRFACKRNEKKRKKLFHHELPVL